MFNWTIERLKYVPPHRPFGKTHKENRNARLIDINNVVDQVNEALYGISESLNNSWDVADAVFVDPVNGDNTTAIIGDGNKPFANADDAATAAKSNGKSLVIFLPGTYNNKIQLFDGFTYYCMPGVIFGNNSQLRDFGFSTTAKVLGYAVFNNLSLGIESSNAESDIYVECQEMDNVRIVAFSLAGGNIKVVSKGRIFCNGDNGGAYACYPNEGATIEVECQEWLGYYWASTNVDSTFKLKCPKITIIDGGAYGNIAKSLISAPGSLITRARFEIDLMGGVYHNQVTSQTATFGVLDPALDKYTNVAITDDIKTIIHFFIL